MYVRSDGNNKIIIMYYDDKVLMVTINGCR